MKSVKTILSLGDEIPKIGSGYRLVEAKVGRKWVRLSTSYGKRAKITKSLWNRLSRKDAHP